MSKLFINQKGRSFVYAGYFYGHIKEDKIILQDDHQHCEVSLNKIEFPPTAARTKMSTVNCFTTKHEVWDPEDGLGMLDHTAKDYLPDLIFESESQIRRFKAFITKHQRE